MVDAVGEFCGGQRAESDALMSPGRIGANPASIFFYPRLSAFIIAISSSLSSRASLPTGYRTPSVAGCRHRQKKLARIFALAGLNYTFTYVRLASCLSGCKQCSSKRQSRRVEAWCAKPRVPIDGTAGLPKGTPMDAISSPAHARVVHGAAHPSGGSFPRGSTIPYG